ncbi:YaiI/YqxD family protein [Natranaerofaba carboxydovora]|uniref:YaiI/YqxD family protein n=1 Tax=Natranaerofaba carboxydovora TaxID=2742683 RepID=UPI001F149085|nr:YaiI/YqxD family protein [Natranaerofaba carboxydovora]UMZ74432.1 putative BCR, YaiI/YqxD family [Natranaerofaba carboxydovora]
MKILVDADSCPVKDILFQVAKEYSVELVVVKNLSHDINSDYAEIITVDKGRDSVDFVIVNKTKKGDIVVTGDYGLASLALSKDAIVIHPNGWKYTNENIESLLMNRYINQQVRRKNGRHTKTPKRKKEDTIKFEKLLREIISKLQSQGNQE